MCGYKCGSRWHRAFPHTSEINKQIKKNLIAFYQTLYICRRHRRDAAAAPPQYLRNRMNNRPTHHQRRTSTFTIYDQTEREQLLHGADCVRRQHRTVILSTKNNHYK